MAASNFDQVVAPGGLVGGVQVPVMVVSADGAIAIPAFSTIYAITKGSAAALTLANPPTTADGVELTFYSETAFAHTVSNAAGAGFNGGGAASDVATFAAAAGNGFQVVARNGKWWVVPGGNTGVTLA